VLSVALAGCGGNAGASGEVADALISCLDKAGIEAEAGGSTLEKATAVTVRPPGKSLVVQVFENDAGAAAAAAREPEGVLAAEQFGKAVVLQAPIYRKQAPKEVESIRNCSARL
jgi:hypothetical protein